MHGRVRWCLIAFPTASTGPRAAAAAENPPVLSPDGVAARRTPFGRLGTRMMRHDCGYSAVLGRWWGKRVSVRFGISTGPFLRFECGMAHGGDVWVRNDGSRGLECAKRMCMPFTHMLFHSRTDPPCAKIHTTRHLKALFLNKNTLFCTPNGHHACPAAFPPPLMQSLGVASPAHTSRV